MSHVVYACAGVWSKCLAKGMEDGGWRSEEEEKKRVVERRGVNEEREK